MSFNPQIEEDFSPKNYIISRLKDIYPEKDHTKSVDWWLNIMFKPTNKFQKPEEWAPHALSSLVAFIRLNKGQKQKVVELRKQTDIPYRGEDYKQYIEIAEGYLKYQENPTKFKEMVLKKLKRQYKGSSI